MDYEELLKFLEIDSPQDFVYFEQFAELVESNEEISADAISRLIEEVDQDAIAELSEAYFDELMKNIPDDSVDVYSLIMTIGQALTGLAQTVELDENRQIYSDELFKFRNWYLFDSEVSCTPIGGKDDRITVPLFEAISIYRAEHLTGEEYSYDFTDALNYDIDEYVVPLLGLGGAAIDHMDEDIEDDGEFEPEEYF
jgi:hypothetical protein